MAIKQLGKKGMFLTFISISLIAVLIIIFTPSDITLRKDASVVETRASNVNNYVLDLENVYLERTLHATGTKTIIALIEYMEAETIRTGTEVFLTDFEADFKQVLLYGTIGDPPQPIDNFFDPDIMTGNTYDDWIDKIIITAKDVFNVDTTFTINGIKVYQIRPWFVDVDADVSFSVYSETASWNKENAIIKAEIEIENFNDPYYLVSTGGSYANKIRKSGTKFDEWNIEKVKDFIRDGNYTHWENGNAPSFIMRFTNNLGASSCCGIESLVNPNNPAISDKDVSYADYKYWSATLLCPNSNLYIVNGITGPSPLFPNFKLDLDHVVKYNLLPNAVLKCPPPS